MQYMTYMLVCIAAKGMDTVWSVRQGLAGRCMDQIWSVRLGLAGRRGRQPRIWTKFSLYGWGWQAWVWTKFSP